MSAKSIVAWVSVAVCLSLVAGCSGSSSDGSEGGVTTTGTGTYAGTWTGRVCGRGLTMTISQSGLSLSGSYAFTGPDFGEAMSGSVSSANPPATATLVGGGGRSFEISFDSYTSLSGGFYKDSSKVCDVSATR